MSSQIKIALLISILIPYQTNGQMVHCDSEHASCDCPSTELSSGFCILDCDEEGSCKQQTLNCRAGDTCHIICDGTDSCSNTTVNGNEATDVLIMCSAENACAHSMNINCGRGLCSLHCDKNTSCSDLGSIDLSKASSFECVGHCPSSLSTQTTRDNVSKANKPKTDSIISSISTGSMVSILAVLLGALSCICFTVPLLYSCCLLRMRCNEEMSQKAAKYPLSVASTSNTPVSSLTPISVEVSQSPVYFTALSPAKGGIFPDTEPVFDHQQGDETVHDLCITIPSPMNPKSPSLHIVCEENQLNLEKIDKTDDVCAAEMDFYIEEKADFYVEEKDDIAEDESVSTTYTVSTYVSSSSSDCETPEVSEWAQDDQTDQSKEDTAANKIFRKVYMNEIELSVIEDED